MQASEDLYTSLRNLRKTDIASVGGKLKAKKYIKNVLNAYNDLKNNSVTTSKTSKRAMSKLSKIFEEYSLRIDPEFGVFWWYIQNLPEKANFSEQKSRALLLLGMYFLANY